METSNNVQKYIELIDSKFLEAKKKRVSRFSPEWGIWSRCMNLEIRQKMGGSKNGVDIAMLNSVLPYWLVTSELLELYHVSKISKLGKKKRLSKQLQDIKDDIMGGKAISEVSIKGLAVRALRGGDR